MQEQALSSVDLHTEPFPGLDEYIRGVVRDWRIPGLALGIVKDDRLVFAKGYGVRKLSEENPIDEYSISAVASVTKAFTAAAVGLLVDEGKVSWDDPVIKHLPDFALYDPYVTREITIRDLLCARSGLVDGELMRYNEGFDRNEVVRRLRYLKPSVGFRTTQGVYTFMFLVAGQLVAAVTGQSWDDFIRERFFKPLGMTSSSTRLSDALSAENVVTPHVGLDWKLEPTFWMGYDNVAPGGAINSNIFDLAQWVRLQLGKGTYRNAQILSPEVVQEMHTPQIIDDSQLVRIDNPEANFRTYGMGWFVVDYRGHKLIEHGGAGFGMSAFIAMIPEIQLGLIMLVNTTFMPHMFTGLKFRIFDAYLGLPERDWNAEMLQGWKQLDEQQKAMRAKQLADMEARRVHDTQPSLALEKYAGTYEDEYYGKAEVVYEQEHLVFRYGALVADLEHWHYDSFKAGWRPPFYGDDFVTFALNLEGEVGEMKVTDLADFKRVAE